MIYGFVLTSICTLLGVLLMMETGSVLLGVLLSFVGVILGVAAASKEKK